MLQIASFYKLRLLYPKAERAAIADSIEPDPAREASRLLRQNMGIVGRSQQLSAVRETTGDGDHPLEQGSDAPFGAPGDDGDDDPPYVTSSVSVYFYLPIAAFLTVFLFCVNLVSFGWLFGVILGVGFVYGLLYLRLAAPDSRSPSSVAENNTSRLSRGNNSEQERNTSPVSSNLREPR